MLATSQVQLATSLRAGKRKWYLITVGLCVTVKWLVSLGTENYEQRRTEPGKLHLARTLAEFFLEYYKDRNNNEVKAGFG